MGDRFKRKPVNPLEVMAAKEIIAKKKRGNIGRDIEMIRQQFGGQIPPGTKFNFEDISVPLNRELSESEAKSVAASRVYPDVKNKVQELIKGGVLNSKNGLFNTGMFPQQDRTVRQFSAQSKDPLLTYYDSDLQMLQSKLSKLKELMFERGGTALTPTEENILGSAFVLKGKNDAQILEDIRLADALVEEKAKLALGGSNAANSPIPGMPGYAEKEPVDPVEAIIARRKKRNP